METQNKKNQEKYNEAINELTIDDVLVVAEIINPDGMTDIRGCNLNNKPIIDLYKLAGHESIVSMLEYHTFKEGELSYMDSIHFVNWCYAFSKLKSKHKRKYKHITISFISKRASKM